MRIIKHEFIKIINDFVKSPQKTFIVNLEDITFVDSAGLGFMFIALQELNNVSKELILRKPQGHVKDLFELLNFQSVFTVEF